jgi:DNA-nicking Smr family endonuclease
MKKSKPSRPPKSNFKNTPFKALKGLEPSTSVPPQDPPTPRSPKQAPVTNEEETALFLRAAEGARKLDHASDQDSLPEARQFPGKARVRESEDSQLFLTAMKKIGTAFIETVPEQDLKEVEKRSPTNRMRQLKRGSIRISQKLDLHGFLRDEALVRLEQFIADACSRRHQAVLVITGKGMNSPEGPVLQGVVADWLKNKGKGRVAEFSSAPRELGGSGAFVVFLKRT